MNKFEIFRNREVFIILFVGIVLILYTALFYADLWRQRKVKEDLTEVPATRYLSVWEGIPWTIKVIVAVLSLAMTAYIIYLFVHPTNW